LVADGQSAELQLAVMDSAPICRHSFWRFSLRELLLLMLAAAAFMGWGTLLYRSQRLKPSSFFTENETWQQEITAIYQELNEPPFTRAAGTMMHSQGATAAQRTMIFQIPLPAEKQGSFLTALEKRVREKLTKAGCKSSGGASGSGSNDVTILGYQHGPISGTVQICIGPAGDDRVSVVLTMLEQQGQNNGFGLENRD
jgi:hypothetical protein